ncbi:MAG TPA: hypothetical protein VNX18_17515 [Bryobacteraceae bacterium]|nr:hypothetical protein [Bryobacteraceae bacterium]
MNKRFLYLIAGFASVVTLQAQPRRAEITGGGGDRGKCTIEVVVDGAAEVEVRGDTAVLRNLQGQTPQWRRFVCNSPMPPNPAEFRFAGVDGRGRQELVRPPQNGGPAVVRIEDPDNGSEGYTFDLFWRIGGFAPPSAPPPPPIERDRDRDPRDRDPRDRDPRDQPRGRDEDAYHRDRDDWYRGEWRARLFEHVRDDLDHAARASFPFGEDRYRIARTRQQLDELQSQMAGGRFDRRELDDVIAALARVVRDNRLSGRDRDILNDDLNRLREVRDHR